MVRVKFVVDIERDAWNIWKKTNNKPDFGMFKAGPELEEICSGKNFEEALPGIENHLSNLYESPYLESFRSSVQKTWDNIGPEFFRRMDSLMKQEFKRDIKGYITTIGICPYNPREPSFMVSLNAPLQKAMATCGHEIMHLYFHEFYWEGVEKDLGRKKTADLKEALTVLLNE